MMEISIAAIILAGGLSLVTLSYMYIQNTDKKSDKAVITRANTYTLVKGKKAKVKVAYTNKKKIQWKSSNAKVAKIVKKIR